MSRPSLTKRTNSGDLSHSPLKAGALRPLGELLARGDRVAIAPQVLAEFVHVVTDARRFQQPFSMEMALDKSERWWNAAETDQVLPTDVVVARFHDWVRRHQLGRKRVLDTLLAATYRAAGVTYAAKPIYQGGSAIVPPSSTMDVALM